VLAGISDWILSLHGWVAIAIVFAVTALEASAFVGFLFPGEIVVLLGGVLASQGRVPLLSVILAAVAGAIIGDSIGYSVGRRWGHQILRGAGRHVPLLRRRIDEHLESARAYLRRRGGRAVFLGRFTAALRVMVPGLAGMAAMPYGEFLFFNAAGGLLWGTTFVLLGYFAGQAWHRIAADASRVGLALLVLILIGLVVGRLLRNVREHEEPLPDRLARLRPVAWTRERFPRQSAWFARRLDTDSPTGFALSLVVVAGVICGWVFVGLTQDVVAHEEAVLTDPGVMRFVVAHRTPTVTAFMTHVTWLGSNAVLVPFVVIVGAYLLLKTKDRRPVVLLVAALVGANAAYHVVKPLVARDRPPEALHLISVSGFAFPSGHATAAIAVYGATAIALTGGIGRRWKVGVWCLAGVIVTLVAVSRVYLGVHWWTDVAAGLALGGAWLCVLLVGALVLRRGGAMNEAASHLSTHSSAAPAEA
jgi:membrane protein DedA with SNARE-associated domain/membrane-associated phospholipid phosphatase